MMKFALISALCVASTMAAPKVSNDGGNLQLNGGAGKVCFTYNDGTATAATGCMADLATTEAVNTQMAAAKNVSDTALAAMGAKLALAEKSITELKTAVDGKVQANTDLTKANAGKITKLELKTAGDLAVLPEILKCAELGQVYSKKDKKCTGAASSKCAILTNLNPLVAADAKLLAVNKHLIASEKVTKGAIVVDTNTCTQKTHFGAPGCVMKCRLGYTAKITSGTGKIPTTTCAGTAYKSNFECVLLLCPTVLPSFSSTTFTRAISKTARGIRNDGKALGSVLEVTCKTTKEVAGGAAGRSTCQYNKAQTALLWSVTKMGGTCNVWNVAACASSARGASSPKGQQCNRFPKKHCSGNTINGQSHSSYSAAQNACNKLADCYAIYDGSCDNRYSHTLCSRTKMKARNYSYGSSNSGSSCLYAKNSGCNLSTRGLPGC